MAELIILRNCVAQALDQYFKNLDGSHPVDLYELVLKEVEVPIFEAALCYVGGNQSKAAKILGLSRGTLRKKIKDYKL
jgi:Fis family transcriptional regulator, factor for inversion stimulation protein